MKKTLLPICSILLLTVFVSQASETVDFSPKPEEQQLPRAMHSEMKERPSITVGPSDADLIGTDHRVLQSAVDYIAGLGGGIVKIQAGEYMMRDSLHLRANVTVTGEKGKTILRKTASVSSPLAIDGDYGEEQITLENPDGFQVGDGVAIMDDQSGGFHTTVARITGRNGNTFSISNPLMSDYMIHRKAHAATVFPVVSGYHIEGAQVENLTIDGDKENNIPLNGCRGAGIFPLPWIWNDYQRLRGSKLQRGWNQFSTIQRCASHRMRFERQRVSRIAPRQRLAASHHS